jgi:DNA-binding NarL/FixJ family response regulator
MNILLVEDNAVALEVVQAALKSVPGTHVVKVVGTQQQANDWLARHPEDWDLALVDLFLAEGHGFEVLRSCRKLKPHQRAVVLSNYSRDAVRQYARLAGADAFFDKSFDMPALVDYCKSLSRTMPRLRSGAEKAGGWPKPRRG